MSAAVNRPVFEELSREKRAGEVKLGEVQAKEIG